MSELYILVYFCILDVCVDERWKFICKECNFVDDGYFDNNYFSLFLYLVKLGVCLRIFILFCFKVCRICDK